MTSMRHIANKISKILGWGMPQRHSREIQTVLARLDRRLDNLEKELRAARKGE